MQYGTRHCKSCCSIPGRRRSFEGTAGRNEHEQHELGTVASTQWVYLPVDEAVIEIIQCDYLHHPV
jgi:hypothetical protein